MLSKNLLLSFDTFIFDLDGTFWWYPKVVNGANEVYTKLKELNKKIIFVTNFTFIDREGIVKTLKKEGIIVNKNQIISSGYIAAKVLKGKKVFPIGKGLETELRKGGVEIVKNEDAKAVVVGHDTEFNYKKANIALKILRNKNTEFYTTAYGKVWIFDNEEVPGTGLITVGLEYCSNRRAVMLGKPSNFMLEEVKRVIRGNVIFFGDENKADMQFANKAKFFPVFVRNGVDKRPSKKYKPKAVINSIKDLLKFL